MGYPELRTAVIATILLGESVSDIVDLTENVLVAIQMPGAWTAASLTFLAGIDGVVFSELYDGTGEVAIATADADRFLTVADTADFTGVRYLIVRSGTGALPVVQVAEREVTLVVRPV